MKKICCIINFFFICTVFMVLLNARSVAQPYSFSEKEVTFNNGEVKLSGTLLLPVARKPVPAIIFLHGSGPMTRKGFRSYAEEYARMGFATLAYDKRGAGASTGTLKNPFRDLAEDAKAAIRFLQTQEQVDAGRIGFWGISQAGWIAPIAAAETGDIAFMIIISGGGASPRESEIFSWGQEFEKAGLTASQQEAGMSVIKNYFHYLATGEGRIELEERIEGIRSGTWKELADLPAADRNEFADILSRILPEEKNRPNFLMLATYNPIQHIKQLECPILLLFGDKDNNHPTDIAIKDWRAGFQQAGKNRLTLVVFPGAGHGIRMREGYSGEGRAPFADGYREVMEGWLWQHIIVGEKE